MHVIFLAPHFPAGQRRFVRGLKNVGARVTGIGDMRPEGLDSELRGLLDGYEYVPHIGDEDALTAAVQRIQARGPWVHYFEATIESHMYAAARVRERTGIPGLSYDTVDLCRDKFRMKQHLRARGIPCARNAEVFTAQDALAFVQEVGFPCVLKPRDGAGAHSTYKLENPADLARAIAETGMDRARRHFTMEEWISGHEGFFDTLTINGEVAFEFVTHYFPNVLPAMRNPGIHPMVITTNRIAAPGYRELRDFGRRVVKALGIGTAATHMEWFFGDKGLQFSEIGARPPGVNFWEVYCAANDVDLYTEWARALCWGAVEQRPSYNMAGGLLAIRPTAQGTVRGVTGWEDVQRRFGPAIIKAHLPGPGARTQPIEAGYLANGWVMVRHPDYDACRAMMEEIGRMVTIHAG
jgi:formate-dependent phosphoribosylglycinamide formyltransferase (GAR transformylase)